MTREEFVRGYAQRSGLSDRMAVLGFIPVENYGAMIALPCGCGEEGCEGWAMLGAEHALHHLQFYAPESLRNAYMAALNRTGGGG